MIADAFAWMQDAAPRLGAFAGALFVFGVLEQMFPARARTCPLGPRWFANLGLSVVSAVLVGTVLRGALVLTALWVQMHGWGLLNQFSWPDWSEIVLAMIVLDLALYGQHVLTHRVPFLWRLHMVHHTDRDLDVTSAIRFHPIEIVASLFYKMAIVSALGASPLAVLLYEITLHAAATFNHANLRVARWLEPVLRAVLVTPAMHLVHHSTQPLETNSNYGNILSIWDRIFGTYRAQAAAGQRVGLARYLDDRPLRLLWCLTAPFSRQSP